MSKPGSIAFHTLGCKLNFSETSTLSRMLDQEGYEKKSFQEEADVYVINTCSVTENADKECKQLIRRVKKQNPEATVVITGCYAQLKPEIIAQIEGVDLVIGAGEKYNIVEHLRTYKKNGQAKICSCDIDDVEGFHTSWSQNDRTRTFLKVQDGCDYTCSFCTIPLARGHSRSDTIQGVVDNVHELERSGVKEIVLTGVNLGDFGKGYNGNRTREENFHDLVVALDQKTSMPRFRISSIEPNLLNDDTIEYVSQSRAFMPHFHIPLQSGSDTLLASMRRRYKRDLYAARVQSIKKWMPHACIGVDVIVGYPGETDELFQETYQFLHALDISYLHVFTYSEREHTRAIELEGVVPQPIRKERNAILRNLSELKMNYFTEGFLGQTRPVLFEHADKKGMMEGYTDNYIKVNAPYREDWANSIIEHTLA
ncbi:MAG: tRNA (N(6)-L-threonylcarbamoyladenosine(37)-C(2))-methylthiotransferase MtaB [Chitinophagaceae bacterium]|nr:tRNA (N(6)-L-threonylcarbamoyladenosine(37)-C(2))-methylthiotransferase MtaB [Chitinophagaceae bacterium]